MATTFSISDHHVLQFTKNQELLLQQKQPALLQAVTTATYQGEAAQKVLQFGDVEMDEFNDGTAAGEWKGQTVLDSVDHHQRWFFPQSFVKALYLSEENLKLMITNPQSPYAETMRAAWARRIDKTIIKEAFGNNTVGKYNDWKSVPLNPANTIPDGGEGLTIDKLIKTQELMLANHVEMSEGVHFLISPRQLSDLLKDEDKRLASSDYNTMRALMTGSPGSVMGFNFILSHFLPGAAGIRKCIAWVKSGMHLGYWGSTKFRVSDRNDLNHLSQLHMTGTLGATRTQENKFVVIECDDSTAV